MIYFKFNSIYFMSFTECLTVYCFGTRLTNTPSVSHWKLYVFYMKITSECFEFEQLNGQHARASPAHTDTGGIVLLLIFQPCLNSLHNGAIFLKNNPAFKFLLLPSQGYYNSTYTFYFLTTNAKTRGEKDTSNTWLDLSAMHMTTGGNTLL